MTFLKQQMCAARKPPITSALFATFQQQPEQLPAWMLGWAMADVTQHFVDAQGADPQLLEEVRHKVIQQAKHFCGEPSHLHSLEKLIDALFQWREHDLIEHTLVNLIFKHWQTNPNKETLTFWFWLITPTLLLPSVIQQMRYKKLEDDAAAEILNRLLKKALAGRNPHACADGHGFLRVLKTSYLNHCIKDTCKKLNKSLFPGLSQQENGPDSEISMVENVSTDQAHTLFSKPKQFKDDTLSLQDWLTAVKLSVSFRR